MILFIDHVVNQVVEPLVVTPPCYSIIKQLPNANLGIAAFRLVRPRLSDGLASKLIGEGIFKSEIRVVGVEINCLHSLQSINISSLLELYSVAPMASLTSTALG